MKIHLPSRAALVLLLLTVGAVARAQEINTDLFRYNRSSPLEWKTTSLQDTANCSVTEASFAVIEGHVADVLIISKNDNALTRRPVVIFQHWGGGDKLFFKREAVAFAEKGFVCVSVNAPWHWKTMADTASFFYT